MASINFVSVFFIVILSIGLANAQADPKPVLYGQAFDGVLPADGSNITAYLQSNASDNITDIVGPLGKFELSSYWKVELDNFNADVQDGDVVIVHLTDGVDETQRAYIVNSDDGAFYISLNLDPAFQDYDGDGFFAFSENEGNTDCNDNDAQINPDADEIEDGVDNDCDGLTDEGTDAFDDDGDGLSEDQGDCDDADDGVLPGAQEVCDSVDNDCDQETDEGVQTTFYQDLDSDTFGNAGVLQLACVQPQGYLLNNTDCNDSNNTIYPGAPEICGDGIDQDCSGADLECEFEVDITLENGWVLFGLPFKPSGIDNSEELGQAIMDATGLECDVVLRFNGETQEMESDILGQPDPSFILSGTEAYFIHCNAAGIFTYGGEPWE